MTSIPACVRRSRTASAVAQLDVLAGFAEAALQGSGLQDLGEQPLGERIFGDAPARRDHLQLACFEIASNPWCQAATVWGRRSRLYLGQWPLLVHELFLPSLSSHSLPSHKELE